MAEKEAKPPAEKAAKTSEEEVPAGPKRIMGLSMPVFGLVALNFLVMAGGFGFIFYWKMVYKPPVITEVATKEQIKKDSEAEEKQQLVSDGAVRIFNLPEMNVNLRSKVGGRNHYATLTVSLKCNNEKCVEELKALRVKVEDTIQSIIAARSYTELTMSEASFRLKHEITKQLNSFLKSGTVTDTYFTDYTIQ